MRHTIGCKLDRLMADRQKREIMPDLLLHYDFPDCCFFDPVKVLVVGMANWRARRDETGQLGSAM
ncbi:hypothetical protein MES5069_80016 [Mesorhizobium escarrei]|uniref:Uncharacterized protein n=1 Tax=Mesorhizobium escarrei TaxID=666018 RepID=A0ABM9EK34_9HYPH|nr:hypothetical protein MES5069_80016 [Mesorhizobium escarrei]